MNRYSFPFTKVFLIAVAVATPLSVAATPLASPVPVIHHTDLYHPHNDPDDHWDLASLYGLVLRGAIDLQGIVIDHPSNGKDVHGPALAAPAQLNLLTGSAVPVVVGSRAPFDSKATYGANGEGESTHAAAFLLRLLESSHEPVAITVTGSCRDVAIAGKAAPTLFREKCRGIYLNAGTGTTDPAKGANREWNALLEPEAYRAIFEIPCPIYWLPCFETQELEVARYGSYWTFQQGVILDSLAAPMKNFFVYALARSEDTQWLRFLDREPDRDSLTEFGKQIRNMWCTAGFLHMAGLSCDHRGEMFPLENSHDREPVFQFLPVAIQLGEGGVTEWHEDALSDSRFILQVNDTQSYPSAMTRVLKDLVLPIGSSGLPGASTQAAAVQSTLRVRIEGSEDPLAQRAFEILKDRVEHRCSTTLVRNATEADIVLAVRKDLSRESFSISQSGGHVRIEGGSPLGLLYGVGKFLRTSRYSPRFEISSWTGSSTPEGIMRGMYFASHFHNWYHVASEEEIEVYVEDLALWGVNAIKICFPFINLENWEDPAAEEMLEMVRRYSRVSHKLGLKFGIGLNNTLFKKIPEHLRATRLPDPTRRRGNSGNPVCPSDPEGHEYLMAQIQILFESLSDVGLDFIMHWPYDEGGCACQECSPWGSRGFVKLSRDITLLARRYYPHIESVVSTWVFDTPPEGEWEGLSQSLRERNDWADYILADSHEEFPRYPLDVEVPGDLPLLNFPEISMWGNWPWGGVGANPLPSRFQKLWDSIKHKVRGGFPYSEGIYEDLNKAVVVQYYWDPDRIARETLDEYISFEYSPDEIESVQALIACLEETASLSYRKEPVNTETVEEAFGLAESIHARLPEWAKAGWRWEILHLRAILDREKYLGEGLETPAAESALLRLMDIYHSQMVTEDVYHHRVRPPYSKAVSVNGNK
jgi:hypothetical protein